jgi:hypothetical protein
MSMPREVVRELAKIDEARHRSARSKPVPIAVENVFSAEELMARVFPEPKWAIPGLLPEGVNILAGKPKLGKSWAALNIAVGVASGGMVLGAIPVEAGSVLYLALEDGQRRLQDRLRKTLSGGAVPQKLTLAVTWKRFGVGGKRVLKEWLTKHPDCRLVVIDTLKMIRPPEQRNASIYNTDYDAVSPLAEIARQFNVSILVVHHTRKQESDDPLDLVSGSLGLTGAADGVLVLKRGRGQADAVLHATGRDFEDKEIALRWDAQVTSWRMLGDAAEFQRSNERQDVIELFRLQRKSLAPKEVSDLLGRTPSATKKLLWTMAKDGDLHADGNGRYSLPNENYSEPTKEELQRAALDPDEWRRLEGEAERQEGVC